MKFLILDSKNPYLNLAIEEYLFENNDDDIFMIWQNEPTVVIGKNQNAYAEINLDYVKKENIHVSRRITGGGAVYHDLGNINYTFISEKNGQGIDFAYFTSPIIEMLADLGILANLSGRNDLIADGRKFSGNAQYSKNGRVLHHGTILFDSELSKFNSILRVDPDKIKTKALSSVSSRVTNLRPLLSKDMDVSEFIGLLSKYIHHKFSPTLISAPNCREIDILAQRNMSDEWIFTSRFYLLDYGVHKKEKYDFGIVSLDINMRADNISDIKIYGDFFGNKAIDELESVLKNTSLDDLDNRLSGVNVSDYIYGMSNLNLIDLIKS